MLKYFRSAFAVAALLAAAPVLAAPPQVNLTSNWNTSAVNLNPNQSGWEIPVGYYNVGGYYLPIAVDSAGQIYCNNCSGGGGGGGGTVTQGAQAGSATGNTWFTQDVSLDAIISGGKLPVLNTEPYTLNGDGGVPSHITNFPGTQPVSIATMPSTPVTGTFWQTTQPVSGTVADSTLSSALAAQGSTTSGQSGLLSQVAVNNSAAAFTTGQTEPPSITTQGLLKVTLSPANTASGFTAPSSAASTAIAPFAFGGFNGTPYALTTGQSAPVALSTTAQLGVDTESLKAGYGTASYLSSIAATPGDVWGICGSASKTVRLKRLHVTALATTAGAMQMQVIIRTTADTSGTSTSIAFGKMNIGSAYAAASATGLLYTANPTTGTLATVADQALLDFGLTASGPAYDESFGTANTPAIVLSGVANCVYVNLSGGTVPTGAALSVSAQTTEE